MFDHKIILFALFQSFVLMRRDANITSDKTAYKSLQQFQLTVGSRLQYRSFPVGVFSLCQRFEKRFVLLEVFGQ